MGCDDAICRLDDFLIVYGNYVRLTVFSSAEIRVFALISVLQRDIRLGSKNVHFCT